MLPFLEMTMVGESTDDELKNDFLCAKGAGRGYGASGWVVIRDRDGLSSIPVVIDSYSFLSYALAVRNLAANSNSPL